MDRPGIEDLHDYQREMIDFMLANPMSACFVDMGLGKTVSTLTVLDQLLQDFAFEKALIIAPIRVARQTWPSEIAKWRHLDGLTYSLIRGEDDDEEVIEAGEEAVRVARLKGRNAKAQEAARRFAMTATKESVRRNGLRSNAPLHIINREMVDWLVDRCAEARKWPYDVVVVDESSSFKDHTSARFKALAAVAERQKYRRMHQLTATPVAENYMGLFAQIYLLDRGKRFGVHVTKFQNRYFTQNRYTYKWTIRPGAEEEIAKVIADLTIVMKAQDYLPLDEPTIIHRPVRLHPKEMVLYRQLETEYVAKLASGTVLEAANAGALNSKLTQMASGAVYDEDGRAHHIHSHKIEELRQIVEEARGRPILVGYWYKSSLARLREAFPKAVVMDRQGKAVDAWNAGKINLLLAHPMGAAHGLNMQLGPGHIMAFFDIPWSYELYLQFIRRLARQGQKNPVRVYVISTEYTVDDTIRKALANKEDAQERLFRRLKKLTKSSFDNTLNGL